MILEIIGCSKATDTYSSDDCLVFWADTIKLPKLYGHRGDQEGYGYQQLVFRIIL